MDGLATGRLSGCDESRDVEVALGSRRRADPDGAVGKAHVERVLVRRRVDRDRLDVELVERPDHADGDLAPVRYEDTTEHGESLGGPGGAVPDGTATVSPGPPREVQNPPMPTNTERAFEARPAVFAAWQELIGAIKAVMDLRRYELATLDALGVLPDASLAELEPELLEVLVVGRPIAAD